MIEHLPGLVIRDATDGIAFDAYDTFVKRIADAYTRRFEPLPR